MNNLNEHHSKPENGSSSTSRYQDAIIELDKETKLIEAQIQAYICLKQAQNTVSGNLSNNNERDSNKQSRTIQDTISRLVNDHTDIQERICKAANTTLITADDTLTRHDHYFIILNEQLESQKPIQEHDPEHHRKLCDALTYTQAELIQTKLDRGYLEALDAITSNSQHLSNGIDDEATEAKVELVKQDLNVLQAEIHNVSHMVVRHEHGDELQETTTHLIQMQDRLNGQVDAMAAKQVVSMTAQLEAVCAKAEQISSLATLYQKFGDRIQDALSQETIITPSAMRKCLVTSENEAGPALNRLKQYLGVVDNPSRSMQVPERAQESFGNVQQQFDRTLAVQKTQWEHFPGLSAADSENSTSTVETLPSRLDELEKEIVEVTAKLDQYKTSSS